MSPSTNRALAGTSRCDVLARRAGGTPVRRSAARTAQRAVPTKFNTSTVSLFGISRGIVLLGILALTGITVTRAQDISALPPPVQVEVDFVRDIQPILKVCLRCHGPERPKSKFRLDNREDALKGGAYGVDIIPGDSANSPLIHNVAGLDADMLMPPDGKGDPLTRAQIRLLRTWIDQGVQWPPPPPRPIVFSFAPVANLISVSGDASKFRESQWNSGADAAGVDRLELRQPLGRDADLIISGRILPPDSYWLTIEARKRDLGFVRGGFNEFRRYYDDSGGLARGIASTPPASGADLQLEISKAWIEIGLTLPEWPRVVLGYEHHGREGTKSSLSWQGVGSFTNRAAIVPSDRRVEESVDAIRLDASYDYHGTSIENQFRAEFSQLRTARRMNVFGNTVSTTLSSTGYRDSHEATQLANGLRLERSVRDWLFLSAGYYYSRWEGEAGFTSETSLPAAPTVPPFAGDTSDDITLERRAHVWNLNAQLGPWNGLSLIAGLQNDWSQQRVFGDTRAAFTQDLKSSIADIHRLSIEENVGIRYTRIPFTVLFGEARFQQERVGQFESNFNDDGGGTQADFLRDTDAENDLRDFKVGFTVSPWRSASLQGSYRYRLRENQFDHVVDADSALAPFETAGNGYPAFLLSRAAETAEWDTRLTLRPTGWLKTTLRCRHTTTDTRTATQPSSTVFPATQQPGGSILAGNYEANVYSVSQTLNPMQRLYLAASFSYEDSRIVTGVRVPSVVPYEGQACHVLSSATWIVNEACDLTASYSFSRADYWQQAQTAGLPWGMAYENQSITGGIAHRFGDALSARLQYGFHRYREPSTGGANNYKAHTLFASVSIDLK